MMAEVAKANMGAQREHAPLFAPGASRRPGSSSPSGRSTTACAGPRSSSASAPPSSMPSLQTQRRTRHHASMREAPWRMRSPKVPRGTRRLWGAGGERAVAKACKGGARGGFSSGGGVHTDCGEDGVPVLVHLRPRDEKVIEPPPAHSRRRDAPRPCLVRDPRRSHHQASPQSPE